MSKGPKHHQSLNLINTNIHLTHNPWKLTSNLDYKTATAKYQYATHRQIYSGPQYGHTSNSERLQPGHRDTLQLSLAQFNLHSASTMAYT